MTDIRVSLTEGQDESLENVVRQFTHLLELGDLAQRIATAADRDALDTVDEWCRDRLDTQRRQQGRAFPARDDRVTGDETQPTGPNVVAVVLRWWDPPNDDRVVNEMESLLRDRSRTDHSVSIGGEAVDVFQRRHIQLYFDALTEDLPAHYSTELVD